MVLLVLSLKVKLTAQLSDGFKEQNETKRRQVIFLQYNLVKDK